MGDRALVVFTSQETGSKEVEVSPTAYLHWDGSRVKEFIAELADLMQNRQNDECYGLARFIGIVHSKSPDDAFGLGCFETPGQVKRAIGLLMAGDDSKFKAKVWNYDGRKPKQVHKILTATEVLREYSHGDAGVVVVDTRDYSWKAFGGYLSGNR